MSGYVLVADDDPKHAELVRVCLENDGHEVVVVHDGRAALEAAARRPPALLVLDVMMPEVDGLDVCRQLGGENGIPIILLTARATETDLLLGLYLGADDYLTKPFSPRELVARVRTVLRRARPMPVTDNEVIEIGAVRIDAGRHQVWVAGQAVELTPIEFEILLVFARRPGRVFSRSQLLGSLHGDAAYLVERTVDSHVMNLRRKIETEPRRPEMLVTVYGVGYKMAEPAGANSDERGHGSP